MLEFDKPRNFYFSQKQFETIRSLSEINEEVPYSNYFKGQQYTECSVVGSKPPNWDDAKFLGVGTLGKDTEHIRGI